MVQVTHSSAVDVEFDEHVFQLVPSAGSTVASRWKPAGALGGAPTSLNLPPAGSTAEAFAAMLVQGGVVRTAESPVLLAPVPSAAVALRAGAVRPTRIHVRLEAGQEAVVLTECDGVLAWRFPLTPAMELGARRSGLIATPRVAVFALPSTGSRPEDAQRRGLLADQVTAAVKVVVLHFAADWLVAKAVTFLERHGRNGPVIISSPDDIHEWTRPETLAALKRTPSARVLLLVHGTFSSTVGAFGGLTVTPWGRKLLADAIGRYDAVIGFDHFSLSRTPLENASALLDSLKALPATELVLDIVCHSRGGQVVHALLDTVLPASGSGIRVARTVFVGATLAGTELARPANWECLVDLVTNLAAVTTQVISLFPTAALAAKITEEVVSCIGEFVKYLVQVAVEERQAPGISAMDPSAAQYDALQPGMDEPLASDVACYAIVSDFRPRIGGGEAPEPAEFSRRLALLLADGAVDRLMQGERQEPVANDLVVDVASMSAIESALGRRISDVLDFGTNPSVYHTNYFMRPEAVGRIAQWLQLPSPMGTLDPVALAGARRNILPIGADVGVATAQALTDIAHPDYLVIERTDPRPGRWGTLRYAITPVEMRDLASHAGAAVAIADALNLHESDQSIGTNDPTVPPDPSKPFRGRNILLSASGRAVGVLERDSARASLVALAREAAGQSAAVQPGPSRHFRGLGGAPTPSGLPAAAANLATAGPSSAQVHALAEMPGRAGLAEAVEVRVTLARERLAAAAGQASDAIAFEVDTASDGMLVIDVIPRSGYDYAPDDTARGRCSVAVPAPGQSSEVSVRLVANEIGAGRVTVTIRRTGAEPLQLSLHSEVTPAAGATQASVASGAPLDEAQAPLPWPSLTVLERRNAGDLQFEYILDSESTYDRFVSKSLALDLAQYVRQIYDRIEQAWTGSDRSIARFEKDLAGWGGALFRQLFPIELQRQLWRIAQDNADDGIRVLSDEPHIPWETVFVQDPDDTDSRSGRFLAEIGVCRWLYGATSPSSVEVRPGRARYVIPHYPDQSWRLASAETVEEPLLQGIGALPVVPLHDEVIALLEEAEGVDLLHFACHGSADSVQIDSSALWLQGEVVPQAGQPAWAKEALLASTVAQFARLRGTDGNRPLVVVNACQTGQAGRSLNGIGGFASAFIGPREGTGDSRGRAAAFIGALWSVGDAPAATFVKALYRELREGRSMSGASRIARRESRAAGDATWLAYTVYSHPFLRVRWR